MKNVCLVLPAYNESSVIADVIDELNLVFKNSKYKYQIVVVNDGSKDETSKIAKKSGAYVIDHILNSGSGAATATGLSFAQQNNFDIAATLDADGQHNPKDVLNGINSLIKNHSDLLIGSRLLSKNTMSKSKKVGNKGLSTITYMLFGVRVTDSQSGLRIFSKKALEQLRWKTTGYEFCSEMIWRAKQAGLLIEEYPIETIYTEYSKQKGQNNWNAFNIVKKLFFRRFLELIGE